MLLKWSYRHRYRNTNVFIDICLHTHTHAHAHTVSGTGGRADADSGVVGVQGPGTNSWNSQNTSVIVSAKSQLYGQCDYKADF